MSSPWGLLSKTFLGRQRHERLRREGLLPVVLNVSKVTCPGSHGQGKGWSWDTNLGLLTPSPALSQFPEAPPMWGPHCRDTELHREAQDTDTTGFPPRSQGALGSYTDSRAHRLGLGQLHLSAAWTCLVSVSEHRLYSRGARSSFVPSP